MGTASSRENDTKRSFSLCAKPDKNVKTETKILCIQDFLTVESKLVQGSTLQSRGPRGTGRFYTEPFLEPLPLKPRLLQQASRNPLWFSCLCWVEDTCAIIQSKFTSILTPRRFSVSAIWLACFSCKGANECFSGQKEPWWPGGIPPIKVFPDASLPFSSAPPPLSFQNISAMKIFPG